jgi:glycosyltransferase involved in cell wall biosynthesis
MSTRKKISIITPCYNAEKHIAETIESVLNQTAVLSGRIELQYIIVDGKSSDNTIKIIQSTLAKHAEFSSIVTVISEKDNTMYEALAKGIRLANGDICAYINAGDFYSLHAFDIVLDIINNNDVKWITGLQFSYNENSQIISARLPFRYKQSLIKKGIYGKTLPFIQQESTFWAASLNETLDLVFLSGLKYAGDYYLWYNFAKSSGLDIVKAYLGGFKYHKGQLSTNIDNYFSELKSFITKPHIIDYLVSFFELFCWITSPGIITLINKQIFTFDNQKQKWVRFIYSSANKFKLHL